MSDISAGSERAASSNENLAAMPDRDPLVGSLGRSMPPLMSLLIFFGLAALLFMVLNGHRLGENSPLTNPSVTAQPSVPPPPLEIAKAEPVPAMPTPPPAAIPVVQPILHPSVLPQGLAPEPPAVDQMAQRLHAPLVVVDLQQGPAPAGPGAAAPSGSASSSGAGAIPARSDGRDGPGGDARTGGLLGGIPSDAAVAKQLKNLPTTIVQGATVQALLETAINSSLPGYARAIVRRDVYGFDGKTVLIPRGSRVIGQYRSAQSLGDSRVFVIWTRVIRPDGVSVDLSSPGGDALGRGGLTGEVDSHFFTRFGDAIMLSVLNAGVGAVSGRPSTQIAIGSTAAAVGTATAGSLPSADIAPTIKVEQGSMVTIFVARDLDFSTVKLLPGEHE